LQHKEPSRAGSNAFADPKRLFVILVILGFGLRIGYGVVRYRSSLTHLSGRAFINAWDHDPLYHVLIAKALLSGQGYIVDDSALTAGRHILFAGQEALFKAPFYEFFLAGTFAVSGFSFKLFFPLQALLGGFLTGFTGLIALRVFRRMSVAWFAGIAAAIHPILVNSASQPYNENLFFFFFVAAIWLFLIWFEAQRVGSALLCGLAIGLCMLTRENGLLLLVAMGVIVLLTMPRTLKSWAGYGAIALATIAVVAPWTTRNYVRFGIFVPVASIVGVDFTEGNNECVATEGIFVPYWAEGPCAAVDDERRAMLAAPETNSRMPVAVRRDRVSQHIAKEFLSNHPGAYAKLVFRRLWTTLLPFDPRGNQRSHERIILSLYWALVFPAGILGMIFCGATIDLRRIDPGRTLLALLIVLNLLAIAAVLYWSDLRFRVGIDLLLACFAGWAYAEIFERWTKPDIRLERKAKQAA
jgi:4-amino-4-deoxy-L-arabinose transferase-like glycosyltransferase